MLSQVVLGAVSHYPDEGVVDVSTYEALTFAVAFAMLVVMIIAQKNK